MCLRVILKEAWPLYRTSSGARLCRELEEPKDLKDGVEVALLEREELLSQAKYPKTG